MPEHEHLQPVTREDGVDNTLSPERPSIAKEDWGSADSRFDGDGFIKQDDNNLIDRVADGKVKASVRVRDYADQLDRALKFQAEANDKAATAKDARDYVVGLKAKAVDAVGESREHLDQEIDFLEGETERNLGSRREANRLLDSAERKKEIAEIEWRKYSTAREEVRSGAAERAHELLDMNPEGLSGLSVEQFVDILDARSDIQRKIQNVSRNITFVNDMISEVGGKIERREKPERMVLQPLSRGVDDQIADTIYFQIRDLRPVYDEKTDNEARAMFKDIVLNGFELSPREILEGYGRVEAILKTGLEEALAQEEQALANLDARIKAGNFTLGENESTQTEESPSSE